MDEDTRIQKLTHKIIIERMLPAIQQALSEHPDEDRESLWMSLRDEMLCWLADDIAHLETFPYAYEALSLEALDVKQAQSWLDEKLEIDEELRFYEQDEDEALELEEILWLERTKKAIAMDEAEAIAEQVSQEADSISQQILDEQSPDEHSE